MQEASQKRWQQVRQRQTSAPAGKPRQQTAGGRRQPLCSNLPSVTEASTQPLTKEDLVNHIRKGCKPRTNWR